ncbi:MAG: prepilin-type N-terminal cleavage/methylation domain-containing protein [Planctomycetaceae bacterium]|nr:prepilin-type N-terminal cleavage/methylation domain-containing protein [Planctomycetaceae bacterium]
MTLQLTTRGSSRQARHAHPLGFTLIELVVVLVIIATIAGLVIPQIGGLGRSSDMAASAKTQADLANNLQLFFVLQKRFPQGMDSLLDSTSQAIYASDTTDANTQTRGLPYAGADGTRLQAQLTVSDIAAASSASDPQWLRSLQRAGFDWVFDHDTSVINSNNSSAATPQRLLSSSPFKVAEVTGTYLISKLVPQAVMTSGTTTTIALPSDERLVAFGVGPRMTAISKTMANPPIYPGADGKYYGRYVAVFRIYASGERAQLVGVIDSYGRTSDYTTQQFNESLPNGGRQG